MKNRFDACSGFMIWAMALLLVAVAAGCGGGSGRDPVLGVNGVVSLAPSVTNVAPLVNATGVPVNTQLITAAFSKAMDPTTITAANFTLACPAGTPVAGTVSYLAASNLASLTLPVGSTLPANTLCTASISSNAKDSTGIALASNFVWSFTTGATPDTTAPTVTGTSIGNGATNVAINTNVGATFSEAMAPLTISATTFTLKQGATAVAGSVTYSGVTAVFAPASNLANSTTYTATITTAATDLAGNPLAANYVWSWTTGAAADTTPPTVTGTINANNAINVAVNTKDGATFSKAMDPLTITNLTLTLKETVSGAAVAGTVNYSGVSSTFVPLNNLAFNTKYTVTVKGGTNGAKDLAGNALVADYVWSWTTGIAPDTTAPTVISTINADGATNVAINTQVGATFSEAMDPLTITNANFFMKATVANTAVAGTVSYSGVNAQFIPSSNLANNTNYTATVKGVPTGVKDLAGNLMASDYVWTWTTAAAADLTAPTIVSTLPLANATAVPVNTLVTASFSKAMDPLTISTASFSLSCSGAPVVATVAYVTNGSMATLTPAANLPASANCTATVSNAAKDIAGNALASGLVPNPWNFTTAAVVIPPVTPASHLGSAGTFGIMATSAITNTGATTKINGDVALEPGTSNGLLPVQVNGAIHINDSISHQAYADLLVGYNYYKGLPPGVTITAGADLGALYPLGMPPGTYTSGSSMLVSTALVLDGGGDANAVWVFQIGSSLTTNTPLGSVSLRNGAQAKNVFWVPSASATIGVATIFNGTIIAGVSATAQTGAVINGRVLAGAIGAGTIALDTATVNVPAP